MIKVSIVTVVYNGEDFLEETILSVVNQTYKNIEYIIIDGGSTDGTLEIIKKYEEHLSYWVSEKDDGIYDAMNKGISKATGTLVGLINADDYYDKHTVALVVESYFEQNRPNILYGDMLLVDDETNQQIKITPSMKVLRKEMSLNHPTCFIERALYLEKKYDTSYSISADYELIMYFVKKNKKFIYIPSLLAFMRMGGASDNFVLSSKEVFLVQLRYFNIFIAIKSISLRYIKRSIKLFSGIFLSERLIKRIKGFQG